MKRNHIFRILLVFSSLLLVVLLVLSVSPDLLARPGGGHSYSGGSGGGGGDGIAELIIWILLSLPPEISIPLVIIILVGRFIMKRRQKADSRKISSKPTHRNVSNAVRSVDQQIEILKNQDTNFSKIVFLDFVSSLYHKYYNTIGKADFKDVTPFFAQSEIQKAQHSRYRNYHFTEIVIGNIQIANIGQSSGFTAITVDIESNLTLTVSNNRSVRYIVTERWLLNRKQGVVSKEPEAMRKITCPNCGAPANFTDAGKCEYCNTFIKAGDMQWMVRSTATLRQETVSAQSLATYAQEEGTGLPTVIQDNIKQNISVFAHRNSLDWNSYWNKFREDIASAYFHEIYAAWDANRWGKVRHLLSDRLYESYNYWIEVYKENGLRNRLDNIRIHRIEAARIDADRFYETITVRIFASCLDYIEERSGKVIGGSKRREREFSEYWTFMRRSGVELKETNNSVNLTTCPSCGAPADNMGQGGECGYCGSKISTGDFSWVLAMIVQDEVYRGG